MSEQSDECQKGREIARPHDVPCTHVERSQLRSLRVKGVVVVVGEVLCDLFHIARGVIRRLWWWWWWWITGDKSKMHEWDRRRISRKSRWSVHVSPALSGEDRVRLCGRGAHQLASKGILRSRQLQETVTRTHAFNETYAQTNRNGIMARPGPNLGLSLST